MRVLMIVDDSKLARIALSKAVLTLYPNWRVVEAQNADTAMSTALDSRVDIVLVDYNMLGRDGLSLATDLLNLHPEMPMALITANFQTEIIAAAKKLGIAFLQKPDWQIGLGEFLRDAVRRLDG